MRRRTLKATGSRPVCDASLAAEAVADRFEGLPTGTTRWGLVALLRQASAQIGLSARELTYLEDLVADTYDVDWTAGSEPVVTTPVYELAERLGVSERQVRNIERALVEKRLLCWRDSGNHTRKGRRDAAGRIVFAYGVSLAPLAARAEEIRLTAQRAQQEASERRRARHRIQALRRTARRLALPLPQGAERIHAGVPLSAMRRVIDDLAALIRDAGCPQADAQSSAQAEICARSSESSAIKKTASGLRDLKIEPCEAASPRTARYSAADLAKTMAEKGGVRTAFYCAASPPRSLRDIADRCLDIARELSIPRARWFDAVSVLGLPKAVDLLCLIDRRSPTEGATVSDPILSPIAFLTHQLKRARASPMVRDRPFGARQRVTAPQPPTANEATCFPRTHHAG
jgi:hypothetical protein